MSLSCWCVILATNVIKQRSVCECGCDGVMFMYVRGYDVALR